MNASVRFLVPAVLLSGLLLISACGDNAPQEKEVREKGSPDKKKTPPPRKTFADEESGSLKVRFQDQDENKKQPEVKAGTENLNVLKKNDPAAAPSQEKLSKKEKALRDSFRTKRPEKSFAAVLEPLNSGKVIRWAPWKDDLGGVRLPAAAISPDRSIILIAETLGESGGPFGTRLVFLDTHSWTITAVHHLWKKDVRFIAIAPDHTLVLAARGQQAFHTKDEIILLDPWSGAEKQAIPLPGIRKAYIHPNGRIFAVFDRDSERAKEVLVFDSLLKDGDTQSKVIRSANRAPLIAFSADGLRVCMAGDHSVELRKNSDLHLLESFLLPEGFITADLLVMPDDTILAAPEKTQLRPAIAVKKGKVQPFGEKSRGMLIPLPDAPEQFFGTVSNRLGRISRVSLSTLREQSGVNPEEGRPRTTGDPEAVFAFKSIPVMAVLDEKGSFYLLYKDPSGKRWRKEILFKSVVR